MPSREISNNDCPAPAQCRHCYSEAGDAINKTLYKTDWENCLWSCWQCLTDGQRANVLNETAAVPMPNSDYFVLDKSDTIPREACERILALEAELERIKEGIKRCQITMIVDGSDMCDWGWMTLQSHNKELRQMDANLARYPRT
jgi:hypothetical protein